MGQTFVQSEATAARRRFYLRLVDATDGLTPETGETGGQPQFSKNGEVWGNTDNLLVAVGNGAYYVELIAEELDTLGTIAVRYKSANTAEFQETAPVQAFNPYNANATLDTLRAWAHDTGVTFEGLMVRLESFITGEKTETGPDTARVVSWKKRNGDTAFVGTVDITTGARGESDVSGSE